MQIKETKLQSVLPYLLIVAFLLYAAHFIGYWSGHKKGWHDAVSQIRYQAGDIIYPPIGTDTLYDDGILLDDIDSCYTPFYKSDN